MKEPAGAPIVPLPQRQQSQFPWRFSIRPARRWRGSSLERYAQWRIDRMVAICLLVGLVLTGLGLLVRPVARAVRQAHARNLAKEGMAALIARDFKAAQEKVSAASQLAPGALPVRVARARLLQRGPPELEVQAWAEVLAVAPAEPEAQARYALSLLRANRPVAEVEDALAKVPAAERSGGLARAAEGLLAVRAGRRIRAENALREAVRLLPQEPEVALALARFLLSGPPASQREGVQMLETWRAGDETLDLTVRRLRAQHFLRTGDLIRARPLATDLAGRPTAEFGDQILLADVLRLTPDEPALKTLLGKLETGAQGSFQTLQGLLGWLLAHERWPDALEMVDRLPASARQAPGLTLPLADLWDRSGRVPALRALLREGDWTAAGTLKLAWLARAAQLEGSTAERGSSWQRGLAGAPAAELPGWLALAARWQWGPEQLAVHRRLAEAGPPAVSQLRAWRELAVSLRATEDCFLATQALLAAGVQDLAVKNDFAASAFLLGRSLPRAHALAWENFQARRTLPEVAATYANSLRLQGRAAEALSIIGKILPNPAQAPGIEVERALILAATGDPAAARACAATIPDATISTEEQALIRPWR